MIYRWLLVLLILFLSLPFRVISWCKQTYLKTGKQIRAMASSFAGRYLAVAHADHFVSFYSGASHEKVGEYFVGFAINVVRFSIDGYYLAVAGASSSVLIINAYQPFALNTTIFPNIGNNVVGIDFGNASALEFLACGGNTNGSGKINLMNVRHGAPWTIAINASVSLSPASNNPKDCRISPFDGMIIVSTDSKLQLYNSALTNNGSMTWNANNGTTFGKIAFNPLAANVIFIDSSSNLTYSLTMTNHHSANPVALSSLTTSAFTAVDFSPNGKYIATGGTGRILYIYDSTRTPVARWDTTAQIRAIAFSRNNPNERLFVGDSTGQILVLSFNCSTFTCSADYYLDATGCKFCGDAIPKCISCSNHNICETCFNGYFINPNTFKCDMCAMFGCVTCNSMSNCTDCQAGFYSVTVGNFTSCKRCADVMDGCLFCNSSEACLACNNDYFLDLTTTLTPKCKLCITLPNCLKCFNNSVCVECAAGFYTNGNTCSQCHLNCLACEASATNCTQCVKGFYVNMPDSYTCKSCSIGCLSCNNSNFCFECRTGMYQKTDGTCASCPFPCTMCQDQTICYACSQGFYLSRTSCLSCGNNCATCNSSSYCATCLAGYYSFTGNSCKACIDTYAFCEYCNSSVCQSCQTGFFLNPSNMCEHCSSKMSKCQNCASNTSCLSCFAGFYLTSFTGNSSCKSCQNGCETCIKASDCTKCFRQYYLDANLGCVPCGGNCLSCQDSLKCQVCDIGYYLDGNLCKLCLQNLTNCVTCVNGTVCVDCEIGFYLDASNNKCQPCAGRCLTCDQSQCTSCHMGFYLTPAPNSICDICPQSCSECTATSCTSCKSGYYLDGGTCERCTAEKHCQTCNIWTCFSCLNGYYLDNTISPPNFICTACPTKIQGCLHCNASNYCLACDYGYYLSLTNNLCASCTAIDGCQECQDDSTCLLCRAGFFLNSSSLCQPCASGCSTCDFSGICHNCQPGFYHNGSTCLICQTNIKGCSLCSTPNTCLHCINGYYLSTITSNCELCRTSLLGCLYCNGSSVCTNCQSGFYLNTTTQNCETCHKNMAGCEVCRASDVCLDCEAGYYLTTGDRCGCTLCSASLAGCTACSKIDTCLRCKTGFYLKSDDTCGTCLTVNSGCQSCHFNASNAFTCSQCSSGFTLDQITNLCIRCDNLGCKICDQANPSVCITCNLMYYKSVKNCLKCNSVLEGCNECSSTTVCNTCDIGYYLEAAICKLCQDLMTGCGKCEVNGSTVQCKQCKSSYILDRTTKNCEQCSKMMEGCTYCLNQTNCISCSNGYFKDSTTNLCRSCTQQQGCILCSNQTKCQYCASSYFLDDRLSICIKCSSVIELCVTCLGSTRCLSCQSGYFVNEQQKCEQIRVRETSRPEGVKLITEFFDRQTLSHTLMVTNDQYSNFGYDLTGACTLYLTDYNQLSKDKKIVQIQLVIKDFKWVSPTKIRFVTDNPTNLNTETITAKRLLNQQEKTFITQKNNFPNSGQRLLTETSSLGNFKVSLQMSQPAINTILPNVYQTGELVLDYSLDEPQFYTSYLRAQSAGSISYSYFGYIISTILIINFILKTYKLQSCDNMHHSTGEIMSHVFALKSIFLFQYPISQEFYYFCYGFMLVDFPWANQHIGTVLGQQADQVPKKLAMYFHNLNIGSTFFLAFIVALILFGLRFVINKGKELARKKYTQLIYGIFMFGITFAGSLSLQGARLNPIQKLTVYSLFYLIGIVLYIAVFIQTLYSVHNSKQKFYRIRIFAKATLLSIAHLNPMILVSISVILDALLVVLQFILVQSAVAWGKIWLVNHFLLELALTLPFLLPKSLLSLYGAMAIVSAVTFIELLLNFKLMAYCEQKAMIKKKQDKTKSLSEQAKLGFLINESLETFIDDKDYNKFDLWQVEYGTGEIGTLNQIALQDQRVDRVKKQFQQNVQTQYYSFGKVYRPKNQQAGEQMNFDYPPQEQPYEIKQENKRKQRRKQQAWQAQGGRKKQVSPFRIESSSSSPTDESALSEEEKKKPKGVQKKNRQKKKINPLS